MPRPRSLLLAPAVVLCLTTSLSTGLAVAAPPAPTAAPAPAAPPAPPAPPPAPDVPTAQAQVAALNAEVTRTTAELTAGTVRLDEGRARLAATQDRAARARRDADAALARAAHARALLARVVNAAYRSHRPDGLSLALSAQPGRLSDAVLADATLDEVQGNQQDALHEATTQGEQAQRLSHEADALRQQATAQATDLERQVAALAAEAGAARTRLEAAAASLAVAQAAATAAAADAARAGSATADPSGGGALCAATSPAGYPNGFLPATALCPLAVGGGHRLRADAAAAFDRLFAAHPVCVTDSYRSYGAQVDVYARKPDLAAVPGTSNHGLGLAVDLCGGIETFDTPEHQWMQQHAAQYGFVHPAWAEPGGSRPEPWHWEFAGRTPPTGAR